MLLICIVHLQGSTQVHASQKDALVRFYSHIHLANLLGKTKQENTVEAFNHPFKQKLLVPLH